MRDLRSCAPASRRLSPCLDKQTQREVSEPQGCPEGLSPAGDTHPASRGTVAFPRARLETIPLGTSPLSPRCPAALRAPTVFSAHRGWRGHGELAAGILPGPLFYKDSSIWRHQQAPTQLDLRPSLSARQVAASPQAACLAPLRPLRGQPSWSHPPHINPKSMRTAQQCQPSRASSECCSISSAPPATSHTSPVMEE